jgi:hypothetical protein
LAVASPAAAARFSQCGREARVKVKRAFELFLWALLAVLVVAIALASLRGAS